MLPRLDDKERKRVMRAFGGNGSLLFSGRLLIDNIFEDYCRESHLEYCIMNFIAWLQTSELGKEVIKKLSATD